MTNTKRPEFTRAEKSAAWEVKDHCEGSCELHGRDLIEVRVWDGHRDWGGYTYCQEAVLCDRKNGLTVFDVSACPRVASERCHHPDPDMCCGGGYDAACDCICHADAVPALADWCTVVRDTVAAAERATDRETAA